jgi:homoserine dehydrogenase
LSFCHEALKDLPIVPMAEVETSWYLRMEADDRPGVLSRIATIFSDQGISIEALIQKAPQAGQTRVPLIVLTNRAPQGKVDVAVQQIEELDSVAGSVTRIRVEVLDG